MQVIFQLDVLLIISREIDIFESDGLRSRARLGEGEEEVR